MINESLSDQLSLLGYDQYFDNERLLLGVDLNRISRVIAEHKGAYDIVNNHGEYRASVSGKFMLKATTRSDYPAVGDWVAIKDNMDDLKIIENILPRRTLLKRKYSGKDEAQLIAANVDVAFIVEAMDRDYSINRFERYVVLAIEGGVKPVIILNKSDLISDIEMSERTQQLKKRFPDVDVLKTSTIKDAGINELTDYIKKGVTYCFLGSSGVGKSTIINKLLDTDSIETQEIGAKTGRGRHTTTAREMYFMRSGGIIIDNPGSREVGITDFGDVSKSVFVDIQELAGRCKYKDCKHINEPGCAILEAVASEKIDASQYDNFQKLRKEAEHYEMNNQEKRQKDRQFGRFMKHAKQDIKKFKSR